MVYQKNSLVLVGALIIYSYISKLVFDKIYQTSENVVDEEFHLQLGKAYCNFEFDQWHPKVTTPPGLYLLSSLLFGGFNLCSTYWLRFTSLLCSIINIILFYKLMFIVNPYSAVSNLISSINLALLPPLYFFSHLYYTDVPSLTMILLLFILSHKGYHYYASVFGLAAILFRQTNIVYVGFVFGTFILQELNKIHLKKSSCSETSKMELSDLLSILKANPLKLLYKTTLNFWLNSMSYGSLILCFLLFVFFNGSIVVGDKSAHEATINIPQLFYFSLFCLFFGWAYAITEIYPFVRFATKHKKFIFCCLILCLVVVHFNTLVHPYVLADNRHYVFYIWNRFYGKHLIFRYLMVPVYIFASFVMLKKLAYQKIIFVLFLACISIVLISQKLLELRYFFIPFVIYRLKIRNVNVVTLLCEFVTYFVINVITLYLFFTKTIQWQDFSEPQRLIW